MYRTSKLAVIFGLGVLLLSIHSTVIAQMHQAKVTINGHVLSATEINDLQMIYGVQPQAGNYWYDRVSGMYGNVGETTSGFMYPDHSFGDLSENCSLGDTEVFMNGRELPYEEWLVWSQVLGAYIQQGSYWFDVYGNIGVEGYAHPVANLYLAAQQRAAMQQQVYGGGYGGGQQQAYGGGSGDNFWSTRFSAGNYDNGGSRGYVSVPGHGAVGYGFD